MTKAGLAPLLLVAGVLAFLIALSADSLGLGAYPGLGFKQMALALVGVILAAVGVSKLRNRS